MVLSSNSNNPKPKNIQFNILEYKKNKTYSHSIPHFDDRNYCILIFYWTNKGFINQSFQLLNLYVQPTQTHNGL